MSDWHKIFLEALSRSPNVTRACKAAGIVRRTAYAAREADPEFAKAWQESLDDGTDNLVGECYRRAARGTRKPVFHMGAQCGEIREYSDTLAIFLLKSHRPAVYREKTEQNHTGGIRVLVEYADDSPPAPEAPSGAGGDPRGDEEI